MILLEGILLSYHLLLPTQILDGETKRKSGADHFGKRRSQKTVKKRSDFFNAKPSLRAFNLFYKAILCRVDVWL